MRRTIIIEEYEAEDFYGTAGAPINMDRIYDPYTGELDLSKLTYSGQGCGSCYPTDCRYYDTRNYEQIKANREQKLKKKAEKVSKHVNIEQAIANIQQLKDKLDEQIKVLEDLLVELSLRIEKEKDPMVRDHLKEERSSVVKQLAQMKELFI